MLFGVFFFSILTIALIVRAMIRYDPKLDWVYGSDSIKLLLWYNSYDDWGDVTRTYIIIYEK